MAFEVAVGANPGAYGSADLLDTPYRGLYERTAAYVAAKPQDVRGRTAWPPRFVHSTITDLSNSRC